MENFVGYVRTSTDRQILGLEEQKSRIHNFIQGSSDKLVEIIVEQESGKNNNRSGLEYATNLCLKNGHTLLFTKLDRLSREVEFLFTLRNKGIKLRCIDLPELNTLTLGIFGSVAQWERELISSRTKRGLAELKRNGIKLGSPQNFTNEVRRMGTDTIIKNRLENDNWKKAILYIENYQFKYGKLNYTDVSRQLNNEGYRTRKGSSFTPTSVRRLVISNTIIKEEYRELSKP